MTPILKAKMTALLRNTILVALAFAGVVSFFGHQANAQDLFRSEDQKTTQSLKAEIDDEYAYRMRIEGEAAAWAKELMLMYRWSALYPVNKFGFRPQPSTGDISIRIQSEFSWMLLAGHGAISTYDFVHAEQSLGGSTSRFVSALTRSKNFWLEVRNQCEQIEKVKKEKGLLAREDLTVGTCAERLRRDMAISQFVGSNASLFIGGGIVISLGKRLFQRFAAEWFAARILPLIPAFARTRWALVGLSAAVIVIPAGFVVAGMSQERETNKVFLDDVQTSLRQNTEETSRASVMKASALATEREVLEFAKWFGENVPRGYSFDASSNAAVLPFVMNMRLIAPNYSRLQSKRVEIETRREELEKELGEVPGITAKLLALAEERKRGALSPEDAVLFRKAQYLASLRIVIKTFALESR